jgi:hypothetical protein
MNVRRQFSYYIIFSEQKGVAALSKEDWERAPMEHGTISYTEYSSTGSGVTTA